jgi:hypothetical protein
MAAHRRTRSASPCARTYWRESARPLTSLIFVAPMLVGYEIGVWMLGSRAARNGADIWLRASLDWIGFGQYFLLPLLTCGLLLAWHHTRRETWQLHWPVFSGMLFESLLLGVGLLIVAQWQAQIWSHHLWRAACATSTSSAGVWPRIIAYCGAGIYEELLFRLSLLPICAWLLRLVSHEGRASTIGSILITSVLFAAAHYRIDFTFAGWHLLLPSGDVFQWSTFCFRFLAGFFFATLFVKRGFGITAGAHALYDILSAIL